MKKKVDYIELELKSEFVIITRTSEGILSFELGEKIYTLDVVEAVSYLIRKNKFNKDIACIKNMKSFSDPVHSFYWLSGGDYVWKNPDFDLDYPTDYMNLLDEFEDDIIWASNGETLLDVCNRIKERLNLDRFIESINRYKMFKSQKNIRKYF